MARWSAEQATASCVTQSDRWGLELANTFGWGKIVPHICDRGLTAVAPETGSRDFLATAAASATPSPIPLGRTRPE
ncbi:hypothetical protein GCM10010402_20640 [Actinomadura luteofluorescens]